MNKIILEALVVLFFVGYVFVNLCSGDTIIFKRKDIKTKENLKIEGKILSNDENGITIETYPGTNKFFPKKEISQVIKGKSPWEIYEQKKGKLKDTPQEHYELGNWCKEHGLKKEAIQEWEIAIKLDPEHKGARKALNYIKDDKGNWRIEKELMKEKNMVRFEERWVPKDKFEELMIKGGYAFELEVTIEEDVDEKFFEEFSEKMKLNSAYIWQATRGQFYIGKVIITDKSTGGNVVIPKGYANSADESVAEAVALGYKGKIASFSVPGKVDRNTFIHEFGHAAFGLPDERETAICGVCVMRGGAMALDGNSANDPQFCTEENHNGEGPACWTTIMQQWPKLVGPANDPGISTNVFTAGGSRVIDTVIDEVPKTKIEIINK